MTDDTAKATLSLRRMRIPISCAITGPSRRIKRAGPPWTPLTESPFVGQAEATGRRAGEGPHRFRERQLPRRQPSPAAAGAAAFRRVEQEIVWEAEGVDEVGRE